MPKGGDHHGLRKMQNNQPCKNASMGTFRSKVAYTQPKKNNGRLNMR